MKKQGTVFLILAVVMALCAALLVVQFLKRVNETEPVVVAVRDLEAYQLVTRDDVKVQEVPVISVPQDAVRKVEDIVGQYLRDRVYAGEVVRMARVADVTPGKSVMTARLTALGRPDLRAFSLSYDAETGVGGDIKPGDRVDIVASVKVEAGGTGMGVGKVVARNVLVLDVKQNTELRLGKGSVLVVALTPQQIEDIAFALTSGSIRFALNPLNTDESAAQTQGVTGRQWLERYGFVQPGGGR
ncbi:MAG: Flp pilus assembly protein CpaB [Bacillota bacterium]